LFTCFVIAFAVANYFETVNSDFANADRIFVVQQRNIAPGADSAALFSAASMSLAKYIPIGAPELPAVARKMPGQRVQVDVGERSLRLPVMFADPEWFRIIDYRFVGDRARGHEQRGRYRGDGRADLRYSPCRRQSIHDESPS
jgi:hypothetical protein